MCSFSQKVDPHHPSSCTHRTKHPDPAEKFKLSAISLKEDREQGPLPLKVSFKVLGCCNKNACLGQGNL